MLRFFIALSLFSVLTFAEEWTQESSTKLNFLELNGYFRTRMELLNKCDLGTFIPADQAVGGVAEGTSGCPKSTLFGGNLRLRLDPTLNVTEDIRVKGQVDVLDNVVLGSSTGLYSSPSYPYSFLTSTQYPSPGMLTVKRAWAEIDTPAGEIRFGRMPMNWGLGVLYNAGNKITNDYGDNIDGVLFATQAWGHYVIPGFFVSYVGGYGRGGGMGSLGDNGELFHDNEWGQRYNLDPSDDAYTFVLSVAKKDKEADIKALLADRKQVLNYGVLGSYRFQVKDSQYDFTKKTWTIQSRDSNAGFLSLWADYYINQFHLEGEAVGIAGKIGNSTGLWLDPTETERSDSLSILQAGVAIQSRYGFMSDKLGIGLDAGWASGDQAYGMGARPGLNRKVKKGSADGPQFGGSDTSINNFRFNPDYRIDLLLFREIIGTVTDAFYFKPHIGYDFTKSFGARLDVISSFTNYKESSPGQSHLLGLEFDGALYYQSEQGIYMMAQYGLLIPFSGLNHSSDELINQQLYQDYGTARLASAFQIFAGIAF